MVLPAAGAALCWLLLTTLWLPLVDYARSYRPLMAKVSLATDGSACYQYAGLNKAQGAALIHHTKARLRPMQTPQTDCQWLIVDKVHLPLLSAKVQSLGWVEQTAIKRPTDKSETWVVFRPAQALNASTATSSR